MTPGSGVRPGRTGEGAQGTYFGCPNLSRKANEFVNEDTGMLNEFALMHDVCKLFPLHYIVVKQVCR